MPIYPQSGTIIYKDAKTVRVIVYPRLNQADSHLMQLEPSKIMCTLIIPSEADYIALKQLDRANSEGVLYVDKYGSEKHYYKRVTLELGEARPEGWLMLASAVFTALDPHLYSAATNEVVY